MVQWLLSMLLFADLMRFKEGEEGQVSTRPDEKPAIRRKKRPG